MRLTHSVFTNLFHIYTLYLLTHPSHVIPHTLHSHTLPITHIHTCVLHSHPHTHTIITHPITRTPHQRRGFLALPPHPPVGPPSMHALPPPFPPPRLRPTHGERVAMQLFYLYDTARALGRVTLHKELRRFSSQEWASIACPVRYVDHVTKCVDHVSQVWIM